MSFLALRRRNIEVSLYRLEDSPGEARTIFLLDVLGQRCWDFSDLKRFAEKFERKMYGIEPGSNQLMLDAIKDPALGLEDWEMVESSEQGMLSEVVRRSRDKSFVVFQGWAPHPMNTVIDMKYLTGGDKFYGPNFGAATVSTQVSMIRCCGPRRMR